MDPKFILSTKPCSNVYVVHALHDDKHVTNDSKRAQRCTHVDVYNEI